MIRAVAKDRRGDIVKGPFSFADRAELDGFTKRNAEAYARGNWRLEEIATSSLNDDQLAQYELLVQLARQANGIIKHFIFDMDMVRRWKNRTPTLNDVKLLRDAINSAADQFLELAVKEFDVR